MKNRTKIKEIPGIARGKTETRPKTVTNLVKNVKSPVSKKTSRWKNKVGATNHDKYTAHLPLRVLSKQICMHLNCKQLHKQCEMWMGDIWKQLHGEWADSAVVKGGIVFKYRESMISSQQFIVLCSRLLSLLAFLLLIWILVCKLKLMLKVFSVLIILGHVLNYRHIWIADRLWG